ncbi:hypothetical protein QWZ08_00475 [Ferruginibacter paludis]|uniref:hypothetical protein n=1 Tax=Ferruginibacter paludis TaxID=1310417 RepID=UPI0025B606A3|nr:hypothetical protein [Ferruginibacter paludis]MDN3654076.1 hypothetical protein [Ferruginibacter paludis]
MLDQILDFVKEHMHNNPEVASVIPADQQDEIHREIATHINNGLQNQASSQSGLGGVLSTLSHILGSGADIASAIEGGLVNSLASKFGLSPMITGAIAGTLPGLINKFVQSKSNSTQNNVVRGS